MNKFKYRLKQKVRYSKHEGMIVNKYSLQLHKNTSFNPVYIVQLRNPVILTNFYEDTNSLEFVQISELYLTAI